MRALLLVVGAGTVLRVALAFATTGVQYDIDSLQVVGRLLRTDPTALYESGRWPYPGAYLPYAGLADAVAARSGLPFHGLVQLPVIAADAVLALVVAGALAAVGRSRRDVVAGAALVSLSPAFAVVSGYHGQIDAVAAVPALLAVLLWRADGPSRALAAGALLGAAAAVKQPLALLTVALLATARTRWEAVVLVAAVAAVPAASLLPFLLLDPAGTVAALGSNGGVPGFGGLSAVLAPDLARFWATLDGPAPASGAVARLTEWQPLLVAAAVAAVGLLLRRRRAAVLPASAAVVLVVYAVNPNFAFHYLVWGLPLLLLARPLRVVLALQVLASAPLGLLYLRPDLRDGGWTFVVLTTVLWLALVAGAVDALRRTRSGAAQPDPG